MRVSKEKAAEHRRRMVRAATRLFRERGIGATGVDSITEEVGLTHGAVYSQFGSKDAIAIESVRLALRGSKRAWLQELAKKGRKKAFPAIIEAYLSVQHRDAPGTGCVVAALGGEISRQPRSVRDAFTEEFKNALKFLTELASSEDSSISWDDALAAFASISGALVLARAVSDPVLSDRILKTTSAWVNRGLSSGRPRPGKR
jgi:TetR/AcrR family transcriptional repressor of nem operon